MAARDPQALVAQLCERISEGELVIAVIRDLEFSRKQLWQWLEADRELGNAYARAREAQAHAIAEQALLAAHGTDEYAQAIERILEWEEAAIPDLPTAERMGARSLLNSLRHSAVQRDRLRVDTLKWTASKIAPKSYGETKQVEHAGKGGGPVQLQVLYDDEDGDV